ncbi:fibronectin type 3 and ankyrin repeat domains 1 protein-like isoform X1 [Oscarella lobularis]|uniref:fibronectin type 3 and ankyrin repeat domains 1 protein-like isoform X1 n=1 Tax=Oscarella lobularis TaxID=121494 RepID=UPI00331344C0
MQTVFQWSPVCSLNTHPVEGGDMTRVEDIISSEAEKWEEVKDKDGNGLLHIAARKNRPKIAHYLIENRIDIELRNELNETSFLVAVKHGHAVVVDLLLSKGCNRLAESKWSRGALAMAICNGQFEMTKKLVEMGFDVDRPSEEYGYTSMHYAAFRGIIQIENYLINSGATLEARSKSGITPILASSGTNNVGLFDMLISRECNIKATEECGHGALPRASVFGRINMVKKLIGMGFDVNEACSHGVRVSTGRRNVMTLASPLC